MIETLALVAAQDTVQIAVIPDTQAETFKVSAGRARWIDRRDFDAVVHVGDVTDWGARSWGQFRRAQRWMGMIDAPKAVAAGNHDTGAVGVGGSAYDPPRTGLLLRDTAAFNRAALGSPTRVRRGAVENSWTRINSNWGVLTLEMWPRKGVVRWANRVIDRHPRMRWIVNTHTCLDRAGRIYSSHGYGATSPAYLRDTLIRPNRAVRAVLCGHIGRTAVTYDHGVPWILTNRTVPGAVRTVTLTGDRVTTKMRRL